MEQSRLGKPEKRAKWQRFTTLESAKQIPFFSASAFLSKKRAKGQAFSTEFLLAYMIFSLSLVLVFHLWNISSADIMSSRTYLKMENTAVEVAENLIRTGGYPENWTSSKVEVIGLANESRILDPGKVLSFVELMNSSTSNYENNSYLLGIGKYDFFFNLTDINGTTLEIENRSLFTGKLPEEEDYLITIERTALLNQDIVRLRLTLWYA